MSESASHFDQTAGHYPTVHLASGDRAEQDGIQFALYRAAPVLLRLAHQTQNGSFADLQDRGGELGRGSRQCDAAVPQWYSGKFRNRAHPQVPRKAASPAGRLHACQNLQANLTKTLGTA